MAIRDKWTEEQLSIIYSLYEYCDHNVGRAVKEVGDIFDILRDGKYANVSISPITLRKIWEEEGWIVNDKPIYRKLDTNRMKELSVIYSLYEYCGHDSYKARKEFGGIFKKNIFPGRIKSIWEEEGWKTEELNGDLENIAKKRFRPWGDTKRISAWQPKNCFSGINPNPELTVSQKEKLDRLFADTRGDAKLTSTKMIHVPPSKVWKYWKSQRFVRGKYNPPHHKRRDDSEGDT